MQSHLFPVNESTKHPFSGPSMLGSLDFVFSLISHFQFTTNHISFAFKKCLKSDHFSVPPLLPFLGPRQHAVISCLANCKSPQNDLLTAKFTPFNLVLCIAATIELFQNHATCFSKPQSGLPLTCLIQLEVLCMFLRPYLV